MSNKDGGPFGELFSHCLNRTGAREDVSYDPMGDEEDEDEISREFSLLRLSNKFAVFPKVDPPVAVFRCSDAERERVAKMSTDFSDSQHEPSHEDGWRWTEFVLDGTISQTQLLQLVDHSYDLASQELNEDDRHNIELIGSELTEHEILDHLITRHGLSHIQSEIRAVAAPALMFKTCRIEESEAILGQTRFGGAPDLPSNEDWPVHPDGKPLGFMAQINLNEVRQVICFDDMPAKGIFYFFSVYGRRVVPDAFTDHDWTQVLSCPDPNVELERRDRPIGAKSFKPVVVDMRATLSLPVSEERPIRSLAMSEADKTKYDWDLLLAFEKVRAYRHDIHTNHMLSGFANYEQQFVDDVADHDLRLLLQLDSDTNSQMCWEDGGLIHIWLRQDDLRRCEFNRVFTECQGG